MPYDVFDLVYLIGFIASSLIRAYWLKRTPHWWRSREKVAADREKTEDRQLMLLTTLGMIVVPFLYLFTTRLDFADYSLSSTASLVAGSLGAALFLQALWLLWRSHADLAGSFSPGIQIKKNHVLVTKGVYERVRHPMYAAHLLWAVAQLLLLQNWIAGPSFLVASTPLYVVRIPREEMMLDQFGDEYRRYVERTGRVLPIWGGISPPGVDSEGIYRIIGERYMIFISCNEHDGFRQDKARYGSRSRIERI